MKVLSISDIEKSNFSSYIDKMPSVALIGSGISLWAPSNLPTGNKFTKSIYSMLFNYEFGFPIDRNPNILNSYFDKIPFEILNDICPDTSAIENILTNIYDTYEPNPLHELFANLLFESKLQSIITPNYDCCLDTAIARAFGLPIGVHMGKVIRVVNNDHYDITQNRINDIIYFKIHGSTDDKSGKSLVFRLNQEGILPSWKSKLFRNILHKKILLVIGYSGSDFDICPEIALAQPKKIIWNTLSWNDKYLSPNLKFLSEQCDMDVIQGDMRELLSLLYCPVQAATEKFAIDIDNLLKDTFNEDCKKLWRIRILNCINYNKSVLIETKKLINQNHMDIISYLSEHAGASASLGKYRDAAKTYDRAAKIAIEKFNNRSTFIKQILLACDAWRCYGSFLRSINRYCKAASIIRGMPNPPSNFLADLDRNLILLIRHPYDLFNRLHLSCFAMKIRKVAATSISRTINYYRKNGAWYQLQQIGLWRERFHLSEQVSIYANEYTTPISNEGYRQLNFPMGYMMAFRHSIRHQNRPLTKDEVNQARELINDAKELGIFPEVWKLYMLILLRSNDEQRSYKDIVELIKAFASCQYSLLFRIWRLVIGD